MKKIAIILSLIAFGLMLSHAAEPDILVTNDGESLKVYNLEVSSNSVFYTLTESTDAPVEKLSKSVVLIIKKADGTVVNLSNEDPSSAHKDKESVKNPDAHAPVTYKALPGIITDKKGNRIVTVNDDKGQTLFLRIMPEKEHTLAVTKWQGKGKYECEEYILPEYVDIDGTDYTVEHIDDQAFYIEVFKGEDHIKNIVFPSTLKTVGKRVFRGCTGLRRIVIPEGVEKIDDYAFIRCGGKGFEQLYIPKNIKRIGSDAFLFIGNNTSYRGFYQGNLTSIPDYITTSNCKDFGIDEEAVEAYEKRNK